MNNNRHNRRPSSDRFLTTFSPPSTTATTTAITDDFSEADIFFTTAPPSLSTATTTATTTAKPPHLRSQKSFSLSPSPSGILAALPDAATTTATTTPTLSRTISISDHRNTNNVNYSLPTHSAPLHVPVLRNMQRRASGRGLGLGFDDDVDDDDDDGDMLPPHELVARRLAETPVLSSSVLEGAGRTLKGRDLRQIGGLPASGNRFFQFITLLAVALAFSRIGLTLCSEVKGTVSCTDCGPDYDFAGIRVLVKCDLVKKLSEAITDKRGHFVTALPSAASTSQASTSPKCLAQLLGGTSQLYALKQNSVSEVVMAQGDENS